MNTETPHIEPPESDNFGEGKYTYDSPELPCAYCARMTPREEAGSAWVWPGKGWVAGCKECTTPDENEEY